MPSFLKTRLVKPGLLIGGCLVLSRVLAGGTEIPLNLPPPGASLYGLAGNGWLGIGDILAPVLGLQNGFVYVDPQFYYHSDNGYTASLGGGYRQLTNNAGILGAYVFGDFIRSTDGHDFWFVSPGIERLGQILDFSANAYLPVSSQRVNTGTEFADQVGDFSQIVFSGHDQFDALVNTFTAVGYGGDVQIGVHLPFFRNSEIFFGGYYFAPKDTDNIGGGAVRLQVPVNRYLSVIASEAYDSEYHNTIKAGLTLWFGGRNTGYGFTGNLAERLVDPIQRDLVIVAGGSATGVPAVTDFENTGQVSLELSNISFFVPDSGAPSGTSGAVQGNGTYENPYIGMSQDNVDNANDQNNRNFYIDSGTYHPSYAGTNDYIVLNNDQLYGRQDHFRQAAQGAHRPLMLFTDGGFEIPATDASDSITGLQLTGMNASGNAGIWIDHENSPMIQTVSVNNTSINTFGDGIDILNSDSSGPLNVSILNTLISGNNDVGELLAAYGVTGGIGVYNDAGSSFSLKIDHTTITANSKAFINDGLEVAGGLAIENSGSMNLGVYSSTLSGNSDSFDNAFANVAGGLAILQNPINGEPNSMNVKVSNSSLSNNSVSITNGSTVNSAGGLAIQQNAFGTQTSAMSVDISNSNLLDNAISVTEFSSVTTAGGLAIYQNAFFNNADNTMCLNVYHSKLSGNSIAFDNFSGASATGGMAIYQNSTTTGQNSMTVNVHSSSLVNNSVSLDNNSSTNVAGGIAIHQSGFNSANTMSLHVGSSNLSDNVIDLNNGSTSNSLGGIALYQFSTNGQNTLTVDVDNSSISGNAVFLDNSFNDSAGGMAITQYNFGNADNSMIVTVRGSSLSNNLVSLDNSSSTSAAGGMVISQNAFATGDNLLNVNIYGSNLSNNFVANNGGSVTVSGGIAGFSNSSNNSTTIDIEKSILSFNSDNGITADGQNMQVFVNRSIITGNNGYGLSAANGGEIDVGSRMLYFNGLIQVNGGTVTFPTPVGSVADGTQVICVLGSCNTVP